MRTMTWGFPLSLTGKSGQKLKPKPVNNARADKLDSFMWRYSFASHAAAHSETLPIIGKLLGHADVRTPTRYAHLDDGHVIQAAQRIGDLISKV